MPMVHMRRRFEYVVKRSQCGAIANVAASVSVAFFTILPLHVHRKGTAVGISANWIFNFLVGMARPILFNSLAWKGYLIFMCLNFSFVPLIVPVRSLASPADNVSPFTILQRLQCLERAHPLYKPSHFQDCDSLL
ncbi:hypothetical protein LEMA_P112440.1 [Plenodomus lingam JN3]|uniref:Major facilitator superfamily (MFS) profile domain-containing protein n=1 Tax=Leptosphaeria maculans (strain JN3 / isolate v23.1.3 / race Av1-4-5-6-7-8) TaxID=985895 RepID=E4ZY80_LEPMJ|nr:hypothetical protein LEMA_P112440.1 [Plenodomus lingam JN3]CBX96325.1 hypothetical protein LEMA_P112440.1 [Plenodomus lingam JN3]